jgi:hypothetical protein
MTRRAEVTACSLCGLGQEEGHTCDPKDRVSHLLYLQERDEDRIASLEVEIEGLKSVVRTAHNNLRNQFAAAALTGDLASAGHEFNPSPKMAATRAIDFADAMLAAMGVAKP